VSDEAVQQADAADEAGASDGASQLIRSVGNIVRLEPDLARAFPTDEAVNEALRAVERASRASRRSTRLPTRS